MARALVRGLDPVWLRNIHRFALKPDAVFYLRISVDELIPRAVFARGFDYWESGMDLYSTEDMYDSFRKYQTALLDQFDRLADEFHFVVVDAHATPDEIFQTLRKGISRVLVAPDGAPQIVAPNAPSETSSVRTIDSAGRSEEPRKAQA